MPSRMAIPIVTVTLPSTIAYDPLSARRRSGSGHRPRSKSTPRVYPCCCRSCVYPPWPGSGRSSPRARTRRAGRLHDCFRSWPNWRLPSVAADGSSGTSPKHGCPGQDPRQLRLCHRADAQQGARHGPGRRRRLARQGSKPAAVRTARRRQESLRGRHRPRTDRERLSVLFTRTTDIVQRLQAARQALQLEAAIAKLDRYDLLILDDLSYVHKDHAETSVLFELIGARYEHRSMLITANQPFADWNKVFPDHAMMIAAIDRLVHHAIIFDMAGTQSWCSTRACRSMPTPSAYIATQSTGARFEASKTV